MKMTFRWYGENDPVTLENIRQIPMMSGVVSAVYDVPVGEVWSRESIAAVKKAANDAGLEFEVVESVPVHEDIKMGAKGCERYIDNYCKTLKRLGDMGVKIVCYNFMPVFDWLRSELAKKLPDGSNALAYDDAVVRTMDPLTGELSLPGWDESYTKEGMKALLEQYSVMSEEDLWNNLERFLKAVIPAAESAGIKMAIHPDDPPWGIFCLPRIITNMKNYDRFLSLADSPVNGLTFCTGSLGADEANDLPKMIRRYKGRIHFAHLRNIKHTGKRCFEESAHPSKCGSLDMVEIVKALVETGFDGYVRPDHGRMIWGERGRAGYGLFDRALGATYILGLFDAIEKE